MKLCNFFVDGRVHTGVLTERGVCDLTAAGFRGTLDDIIVSGALPAVADAPCLDPDSIMFANVTTPSKLVCIGLNYKKHAEETGGAAPAEPVVFSKFNDALSPAGGAVRLPARSRCYDYEAELVIVIGRWADNVSVSEARDHIFGYTCGNDLSARDAQMKSTQWLIGKTYAGFAPAGPFVVTADEFSPDDDHRITCTLNGAVVQDDLTSGMIFSCAELVSYVSAYTRLAPGDLIFTGTPSGVILGKAKGTRVWMKKGDVVSVSIDGIGTLTNTMV